MDLEKFVNEVPMEELFNEIRRQTGLKDLKFTYSIKENRSGQPYIDFTSEDIVDSIGFMKLGFSSMYISSFNSEAVFREGEDTEPWYYISVDFSYTHPGGGSNGTKILSARYRHRAWEFDWEVNR